MSYATYLANKLASQQKVVSVKKPTDASMITQKRRFQANMEFSADGRGVGRLAMDTTRPDGIPLLQHPSTSSQKATTRPADASDYTAYRGGRGIQNDAAYLTGGGSDGKKELICSPRVDNGPPKYKGSGDVTKDKIACDKTNTLRDPPKFVDNTIRLSAMHPEMINGGCCDNSIVEPNHVHSEGIHPPSHPTHAITQHTFMAAPPLFQNQGVGGARIGAYYNPRSGYVENKHGNDLKVNPRRVPGPWVYSSGAPAHLKINDPTFANVKP